MGRYDWLLERLKNNPQSLTNMKIDIDDEQYKIIVADSRAGLAGKVITKNNLNKHYSIEDIKKRNKYPLELPEKGALRLPEEGLVSYSPVTMKCA